MRSRRLRTWLVLGTVPVTVTMAALPATGADAASLASTAGAQHDYIVFLKNTTPQKSLSLRADHARSEQAPVRARISSLGGHVTGSTTQVSALDATMTTSQAKAIAASPDVAAVIPNSTITGPSPLSPDTDGLSTTGAATSTAPDYLCGSKSHPQLNPEALYNINDVHPSPSADGAGITVALVADGLDPTDADFQRNPAFASTGSPAGSPVVTEEDFSTDGTNVPTDGGEAFLDASSIAAQGNKSYNLNDFVSSYHKLDKGKYCGIKIQGAAPGANVLALKVFAEDNDTTLSGFVQAINYAVSSGVLVINESFGANNFPDLADADAVRLADDAAVAAGVTVVVSTGDGGPTSTIGSPATDPNVISVGATTTFRAFEQFTFGGINDSAAKPGKYVDNNMSSFSSGGVSEGGTTVDLVAPGDANWALCSTDDTLFTDCTNASGKGSPIQFTGGTSEAAPLTAGAAADVIQAYAETHGGSDPSPALVKQILMSSATDIDAPATEQGAGLLNVGAAVALARTIGAGNEGKGGGVLVSPNQINIQQDPGASTSSTISVTNTSSASETVHLSTRALTHTVRVDSGTFCMQTGKATKKCPANKPGVLRIWSGVKEVFQNVHFYVPKTHGVSRLSFSADYPFVDQTSLLHFALVEPNGTYAGYSDPQGLADFGNVQVSNPPSGVWTAVFFTEKNGATAGGIGSHGKIQWSATTQEFRSGSKITPSVLTLGSGDTGTATLKVTNPSAAGDTSESVVVSSAHARTTIPVVIRTLVATNSAGGSFHGVLTGGNGRADTQAQANDYVFNVPSGTPDLGVSVTLANDPNDIVIAQLVAPDGTNLGYSTNVTYENALEAADAVSTRFVNLYSADPQPGQWTLLLEWQNPVSGSELSEPFSGKIKFGTPDITASLPDSTTTTLTGGTPSTYTITVHNSGPSPEWYFADPRDNTTETISLPNQNSNVTDESDLTLPLAEPTSGYPFPYYIAPSDTSALTGSLTSTVPVDFDMEFFPGDPDVEGTQSGDSASYTVGPDVSPGLWDLNPDEVGPYPASGAPSVAASASMSATTATFSPDITSSTGDFWTFVNGGSSTFAPVYVASGKSATIQVTIDPTGAPGSTEAGTIYVDDVAIAGLTGIFGLPTADQVIGLPFSYTVGS